MPERKLLEQVSDVARFRHLSLRTEQAYITLIKRYILFHRKRHEIRVREGKGHKDRLTMLPRILEPGLRVQIETVSQLHEHDLKKGYGEVYLPHALERKYPKAGKEFIWQYLFPADKLSIDPRSEK